VSWGSWRGDDHTYLVNRRGTQTHGRPTMTSCAQIGEPVDVAYLMVPQAGMLEALDDAAAAGIRNACVLSGRQMAAALALGASGVWCGSVWLSSQEDVALRLESFFVGQVVGSFQRVRPAAEITRQIVADCEQRIAGLARTLPGAAS